MAASAAALSLVAPGVGGPAGAGLLIVAFLTAARGRQGRSLGMAVASRGADGPA